MEASTFGPLAQYGAVGIIAAGLLTLVVLMFKSFVDNAIKTNAELQKQNFDMQMQSITALNAIKGEVTNMKNEIVAEVRELDHTVANMFNELSAVTGGSRGYAIGVPRPKR